MRHLVRNAINQTLETLKAEGKVRFETVPNYVVEPPKNPEHGDWSVNVAMVMAKAAGMKPVDLAKAIAESVPKDAVISSAEVAGPGFLNLRLHDAVFQNVVRDVLKAGDAFGRVPTKSAGKKALVEFVSANPTGPVHIGHARGAFMGDAVARLLDAAGWAVTREFYINDFGKQVETLAKTVYKRYLELFGKQVTLEAGEYPAAYVIDIAKVWKAEAGDRFVNAEESVWFPAALKIGLAENLKAIRATLEQANITHNNFYSEQSLHASGAVKKIVDVYKSRGVTYEATEGRRKDSKEKVRNEESKAAKFADRQHGGTFLMTSTWTDAAGKQPLKDDEDRIILRADGSPVYLTADLAYHDEKFQRGYDLIVDVFGADHAGHVPRIESGMTLLGHDIKKLKFLLVQIVRITRGGEEVKVSKRAGTVFELADLIEDASSDVCRFIFLMKTRDAQFDFDLDAITKQSKDNPVFYFQYGHARCANVLKKAAEKNATFVGLQGLTDAHLAKLVLPEEKQILKKMSQLGDVVISSAERLEPHHVLYFCQELISDFHGYYTKYKNDPIISDDPVKTQGRLALVAALKQTLKSAFGILGISAPEYMEAPADDAGAEA